MTERSPKLAEYQATRNRLYDQLRDEVRAIKAISWLAHHAREGNRTSYSEEDYSDSVDVAMEHILACSKRADNIMYGEVQQNSLDYLLFEIDRLGDRE